MRRTFWDHQKKTHTLDLDAVQVDGQQVLQILAEGDYIQFETVSGTVTCLLEQIWQDVAGPTLTAREAGALLMECLARQILLDQQQAILRDLSLVLSRLGGIEAASPSLGWLTTRLDPLARQAMSAYDGSDTMTQALARILQQDPATILVWAYQLGLEVPPVQPEETTEVPQALAEPVTEGQPEERIEAPLFLPEPVTEETVSEPAALRFRWTPERLRQLQTARNHCTGDNLAEHARSIAGQYNWPVEKVQSKLYELRNSSRHSGQAAAREAGQEETPTDAQNATERALIESTLPPVLARGNCLWTVLCGDKPSRWPLDYSYGTFPFQAGQQVTFGEAGYQIEQVGTSLLRVSPTAQQSIAQSA
jgi:hypothetical protein